MRENREMTILSPDLRYALRTLRKNPGFTATALAALTLGIGATTAIFSVVNTVLLKPLTFPDPNRIVTFFMTTPNGPAFGGSATRFNVWRQQTQAFEDVSAYEYAGANLNLTGETFPEQIHGIRVTPDYFRLLGAPVIQGRTFTIEEAQPNGPHVTVLSYGLWQRHFAADPHILGKTISLSGTPHVVVGIVGPAFNTELDTPPDVWLPFQIDPASTDHAQYFSVIARLKPGVTLAAARAQLHLAADEFRRKFPNMMAPRDSFSVQPYPDAIVSEVRSSLLVLAGAVSFVLLIACANVANLLLARATGRKREIALRAAVGASRGRIIRQLLTESVVLSVIGGALGLGLGLVGVRALVAINPGDIPRIGEHGAAIALDWRLLLFTLFVSIATGVLFGLIPAFNASRTDLSITLNQGGGRSGSGFRQNKTRSLLVISEVALALVLLAGAALLIRTFAALRAVNPGFDAHSVLTMRMSLGGSRFSKTAAVSQLIQNAVERIESLPSVSAAAASYLLPLEGGFGVPFNIVGRIPQSGLYDGHGWMSVSPHYFDVFKIPVLRGRAFNQRDDASGAPVAIINQALARQFFPKGDPIGERVLLGKQYGPEFEEPERQVIGVAQDVHDSGLNRNPTPMVYVPMAQVTDGITALANRASRIVWIVRSNNTPPNSLRAAISKELEQASGGLPVSHVRSMDEIVSESTARANFNMTLLTVFGAAALLLAVIGIYGLMAYSVRQRTREIGIRLALGADSQDVRNMVVAEGMRLALAGVALGTIASFGLTRLLQSFLFGVGPLDPVVFVTVPALLGAAALAAVWFPARRAAATDPAEALRN